MKFLRLIITIPASLLRLFSEGSSLLQLSSSVEMSAKGKRNQNVMSIKTHFTTFVKWVTSRSRNKSWLEMKISCEPDHSLKERRENWWTSRIEIHWNGQKLRFRSQQSFKPVSNSEVFRRQVNKEDLGSSYCAQESGHENNN